MDRCLPPSPNRNQHWAKWVWVWRHDHTNRKNLHAYALCNPEERAFDRLAEITPQDDLEAWDDLLIGQSVDNGQMRAFCRWVSPRHAEALRENFHHSDRDWRTCAFLNYLAKAPEPILRHHLRGADEMPAGRPSCLTGGSLRRNLHVQQLLLKIGKRSSLAHV
jgi:hypothetical protein